jgi:SAM-dependent methyltransferase
MRPGKVIRVGLRRILPIGVRRLLVRLLGRQTWLESRYWLALELLRDEAERDPESFHRFLWTNHLAYAESYDVERRFGKNRIHPSRMLLFQDLARMLAARGVEPTKVESVFEVGCSLGYLLRHLETTLFTGARILEGNDIDRRAIRDGSAYLAHVRSKARLHEADTAELSGLLGSRRFDVTLCAGVLMYLQEDEASRVVSVILSHTNLVAVFAGLAHPERDNRELARSDRRDRDGTFIHNLDRMVEAAGGRIRFRRWDGPVELEGNTIYFVFATPKAA